ncbi:fructosamine kinase family protein [Neoactinobaculum massilliense]|mgnify:CR=1 FL=1|uniref:fructosamine kinase family protein n=1 Tax=Neoactinobaculum massilliense TaxID=2364794 RepID=UPI000F5304FC|nr:fructosamine kinase family protein [Neoactinobaculum massilliense]
MRTYTKHAAPEEITAEYAGLMELGEAAEHGGAPTVRVMRREGSEMETALLAHASPTRAAAEAFGRRLAHTHAYAPTGKRLFGQAPALLAGPNPPAYSMDPSRLHLVPADSEPRTWGEMYAADFIEPFIAPALRNGAFSQADAALMHRLADRVATGMFDAPQPALVTTDAALLHGDLWSGNVFWTTAASAREAARGTWNGTTDETEAEGTAGDGVVAVLIDPISHGGHAETDLAALTVFGAPFVDRIYAAYNEESPLADGWEERVGLHRIHMLVLHAALFGGGYGQETVAQARAYL